MPAYSFSVERKDASPVAAAEVSSSVAVPAGTAADFAEALRRESFGRGALQLSDRDGRARQRAWACVPESSLCQRDRAERW